MDSASRFSSMERSPARLRFSLIIDAVLGGMDATRSARSFVTASTSAGSHRRLRSPSRSASSAEMVSPSNASSLALFSGSKRDRAQVPPKSTTSPRFTNSSANAAVRVATTKSHDSAKLHPAPAAIPVTFAIVGVVQVITARAIR
jgi:hypothetical protein